MSAAANATRIEDLEPRSVWQFFAGIAAVPRESKKEQKARAHVKELAAQLGLEFQEDGVGNIVISVPASPGCESAPITVIQGHLDMVCEKNSGTEFDFDREGIRLVLDTDAKSGRAIVRGDGTTLGADNGIGLAMGLAAATLPEVKHPPLELLFTIDEEAGMTGAKALTPESFKGRRLINLDSEEDNALYMGCAGGRDTTLSWTFPGSPVGGDAEVVHVVVEGLRGGHSGGDIHENRGNANKLLAQMLSCPDVKGLQIAKVNGGSKRNAIAREASATVVGPSGTRAALEKAAGYVREQAANDSAEPGAAIRVEAVQEKPSQALSTEHTTQVLGVITALPHGVLGMSRSVSGLVETSNNVAIVTIEPKEGGQDFGVVVASLTRSSSESWKQVACDQIAAVGRLAGAKVETGNDYAGWEPNVDSPILATCQQIYEEMFGEPPEVAAIHAGLECGIIGKCVGKMDMVSLGPTITGAHSPDEIVFVDSVEKSWKYFCAILSELAKG